MKKQNSEFVNFYEDQFGLNTNSVFKNINVCIATMMMELYLGACIWFRT